MPAIVEFVSTVMHQDPANDLKMLPLSDTTVSRRIDEMADDIESQLVAILQITSFSMQLHKSTITNNNALMANIRFFNKKSELQKELVFAQNLITDMRGLSIFTTGKSFFEKYKIPLTTIAAYATDGASSMVSRYQSSDLPKK